MASRRTPSKSLTSIQKPVAFDKSFPSSYFPPRFGGINWGNIDAFSLGCAIDPLDRTFRANLSFSRKDDPIGDLSDCSAYFQISAQITKAIRVQLRLGNRAILST
jgi:hypothetical protein